MVESRQSLAGLSVADVQATSDLRAIEGVHRLTEQQHHVVGDVRGHVDRTLTSQQQAAAHPPWGLGVRIDAGDTAQTKAAGVGVLVDGDIQDLTFDR